MRSTHCPLEMEKYLISIFLKLISPNNILRAPSEIGHMWLPKHPVDNQSTNVDTDVCRHMGSKGPSALNAHTCVYPACDFL